MKANIAFCERYAKGAETDEQKDIAKAIASYEAQIAWAKQMVKQVDQ